MNDRPQFESRYFVGIGQVDREHQQLFDIAGRVYDGLAGQDQAAFEVARAGIAELLDYTATHFAR